MSIFTTLKVTVFGSRNNVVHARFNDDLLIHLVTCCGERLPHCCNTVLSSPTCRDLRAASGAGEGLRGRSFSGISPHLSAAPRRFVAPPCRRHLAVGGNCVARVVLRSRRSVPRLAGQHLGGDKIRESLSTRIVLTQLVVIFTSTK